MATETNTRASDASDAAIGAATDTADLCGHDLIAVTVAEIVTDDMCPSTTVDCLGVYWTLDEARKAVRKFVRDEIQSVALCEACEYVLGQIWVGRATPDEDDCADDDDDNDAAKEANANDERALKGDIKLFWHGDASVQSSFVFDHEEEVLDDDGHGCWSEEWHADRGKVVLRNRSSGHTLVVSVTTTALPGHSVAKKRAAAAAESPCAKRPRVLVAKTLLKE